MIPKNSYPPKLDTAFMQKNSLHFTLYFQNGALSWENAVSFLVLVDDMTITKCFQTKIISNA